MSALLPPLLLSLLLSQAPAPDVRLASPGLSAVGLSEKEADFFADYFAQQLVQQGGVRVVTRSEVAALVGFERQKQLLGCGDESSSCLAELAGALGVDGLVIGSVARTRRGSYAMTLKVVSAGDARSVASDSTRAADEEVLLDWLAAAARRMAPRVKAGLRPRAPQVASAPAQLTPRPSEAPAREVAPAAPALVQQAPAPQAASASSWGLEVWVPGALGAACAVGGGVLYGMAHATQARLASGQEALQFRSQLTAALEQGRLQQTAGLSLLGAGALGLGVAAGFALLGGAETPPPVSLALTPGGVQATLQGRLP